MRSYYTNNADEPLNYLDYMPLTYRVLNVLPLDFPYTPGQVWIVKPGENSNRGRGIHLLSSMDEILSYLEESKDEKLVL